MRGGVGVESWQTWVFEIKNGNGRPVSDQVDDNMKLAGKKMYEVKNE